ncbi:universal stress protein [Hyphobacterium sp. CCMP332]|nr:universal stress protein [Hyphobacterium sp. CCMP332]
MEIKQVLVALDFTEMDENLIRYACFMDKLYDFDKVYFLHVAKTLEYPQELLDKHPELLAPLDDTYKHDIKLELGKCWKGDLAKAELKVVDGNPEEQVLKWAKIKEVDLILLGRKVVMKGSGLVPGKVARAAPCSIMLVPEKVNFEINKILLSVDFSRHSHLVAEQCLHLAEASKNTKLVFFHVYHVPMGYSKIGKTFEEFAEIMKGHAKRDMNEFISKLDLEGHDYEFKYVCSHDKDVLDEIVEYSVKNDVDVLAVGSKGRTNAASFLLGSLAEKLVNRNAKIPFLIVKQKGSNMGFLEAIFRL